MKKPQLSIQKREIAKRQGFSIERLIYRIGNPAKPHVLQTILELVSIRATLREIRSWTPLMRAKAEEWALAVHLRASDNIVRVPKRPVWIPKESA